MISIGFFELKTGSDNNMYNEKSSHDKNQIGNDTIPAAQSPNRPTEVNDIGTSYSKKRSHPTDVHDTNATFSSKNNLSGSTINSYNLISLLSSSGESELYKCSAPNGQNYCIKIYFDAQHVRVDVREKLKNFRHDNVLPLIDWGFWNNRIFEVFPLLIDSKSLYDIVKLKQIKNYNVKSLIKQTAEAIHALHKLGVVHQDIKPENLMISSKGKVIVIDFGVSGYHNADNRTHVTVIGRTLDYASPEVRQGEFCGAASDFYSLGATIYYLLFGMPPFLGSDFDAIANTRIPHLDETDKSFQHILYGLMQCNKDKRWQYEAVIDWCNNNYAKWVIPISSAFKGQTTVKYTFFYNRRSYEFEIPNQLPELVITLAQQWNIFLINVNGQFEILANKIRNATEMTNWERIFEICILTYEDMARIYHKVYSNNAYVSKDVIYFIKLYELYPEMKEFGWKGLLFQDISTLGTAILQVLWKTEIELITGLHNNSGNAFDFYNSDSEIRNGKSPSLSFNNIIEIIRYHLISHYCYVHEQTDLANTIYEYESSIDLNNRGLQEGYYRIAYILSSSSSVQVNGEILDNLSMFQGKINTIIEECATKKTNEPFNNFCDSLCIDGALKPGFKVWAEHQGFKDAVSTLVNNMGGK